MKTENKSAKNVAAPARKRGNVLDLLILLILIACILGIGYRYYTLSGQSQARSFTDATVSFEIKGAIFTLPTYVQPGDEIRLENGNVLGTVRDNNTADDATALYVSAASVITTDEDGNYIRISYPDSSRVDCLGSMSCRGIFEEDGSFLLDGVTYLTPGSAYRVHTETASFTLVVTACTSQGGN